MASMATSVGSEFEQFDYVDLNQVDPNYSAIEEDTYTLKVIKLVPAVTRGENGKEKKPYLKGTFSVTNHDKHSARRLFGTFWDVNDPSSRDVKALRRIMDVTGVQQSGSLLAWAEEISQAQPEFKAIVRQKQAKDFTTKELKTNADGSPVMENVIDFRKLEIA